MDSFKKFLTEETMKYAQARINGKLVWLKNVKIKNGMASGTEVNKEGDEVVPKGKNNKGESYTDRVHVIDLTVAKLHPARMNNTYGELEKE